MNLGGLKIKILNKGIFLLLKDIILIDEAHTANITFAKGWHFLFWNCGIFTTFIFRWSGGIINAALRKCENR